MSDQVDRAKVREWLETEVGVRNWEGPHTPMLTAFDAAFPPPLVMPRCHFCNKATRVVRHHDTGLIDVWCDNCKCGGPRAATDAEAVRLYELPLRIAEACGRVEALNTLAVQPAKFSELLADLAAARAELKRLEDSRDR